MSFGKVSLTGIILSILTMFVLANIFESNDSNVTAMYFAVFIIPVIAIALINAIAIVSIIKIKNKAVRLLAFFALISIYIILSLFKNTSIPYFDGMFAFVGITAAFALGITNIFFLIKSYSK